MEEKALNEIESLKIIENMIESVKSDFREDGFLFILWGWLVFIAAISHYLLLTIVQYKQHWLPWNILMPLGGVVSIIYSFKKAKKKRVKSHLEHFMKYIWTAFLAALFIILFFMKDIGYDKSYPLLIMIYGVGTYITGGALRFKPLILGGVFCWVIAIISFFLSFQHQLLALALAILVSYIIPGHILKSKVKYE